MHVLAWADLIRGHREEIGKPPTPDEADTMWGAALAITASMAHRLHPMSVDDIADALDTTAEEVREIIASPQVTSIVDAAEAELVS